MYTITLPNGTKLENLKLNGNNFVSATKIDETLFSDILSEVKIENDESSYTMRNVSLLQQMEIDNEYYFILVEQEISNQDKVEAQVMYTALMTDTLLEEE